MADTPIQYHIYPQSLALSAFIPLLKPYLPTSNPLYNRLQAPHNTPERHCLFASTIPPTTSEGSLSDPTVPLNAIRGSSTQVPAIYTLLFADRSRHHESQIWIFNPIIAETTLIAPQVTVLREHIYSMIQFLKTVSVPEAPGWPFSPVLRMACIHPWITETLKSIASTAPQSSLPIPHLTNWQYWAIATTTFRSAADRPNVKPLPPGFTSTRVPESQLDIVLSTSSIKRQPLTMLLLPNVGILDPDGKLVAWGYIGIDGAFATLYVLPAHRGKGFAKYVAVQLLGKLSRGEFKDIGFLGQSGYVHSDVADWNMESTGVMKSLGGKPEWRSSYLWIDSGLIP